ncbi:hypothetical protein M405DRAFT_831263 [Rhizopogon salebrosus TDB-379]|nr:hypothetical protein M405DRAFT_831263 [Rhizopogon salebrosus TDB-379]
MINRLPTAPTNPSTTRLSIAQPAVNTNHTSAYSIPPTTTTIAPTTSTTCPAPRPSMDMYAQFSDPGPSGFGGVLSMTHAPPPSNPATLRASRTTQYADSYASVRVSLATSTTAPPSDELYTGYRYIGG